MRNSSRSFLLAAIAGMGIFFVNLILGKAELLFQVDTKVHLEGVPEFLLLLATVICFVIAVLLKTREEYDKAH